MFGRFCVQEQLLKKLYYAFLTKMKNSLLNTLFEYFALVVLPLDEQDEFEEMELKDIFLMLGDIVSK